MHVLIVHAHPEPQSFNGALTARAREALTEAGHVVEVSDLCADGFDPRAGRHDFAAMANPDLFHYQAEQAHAAAGGGFAPEIAREQARVAAADLVIFQFPLWWGGPPAVLKGWLERVLAYGFAYVDGRRFDSGLFRGRRAMISVTTGGTPERFSEDGVYGPLDEVLRQMRRLTLEYMGYEVEPIFASHAAPRISDAERAALLDQWAARVVEAASRPVARSGDVADPLALVGAAAWARGA